MVYWSNDSGFLQNATFVFMKMKDMNFTLLAFTFLLFSQSNLYPLPDQKNFPSMPIWIIGSKRSIVIMFYYISEKRTTDFVSVNKYIFIVCPDYILQWFNILTSYTGEAINYHKKLTKWPKKIQENNTNYNEEFFVGLHYISNLCLK